MQLTAVRVPEDTTHLSAWLEQQLLGDGLGSLVAELRPRTIRRSDAQN